MTDTFLTPGSLRPPVDARPTAVGNRANDKNSSRLREACSEFEALFINLLLKELRATVGKSGLMDGGQAEEVYTGMMDTEMARDLAQTLTDEFKVELQAAIGIVQIGVVEAETPVGHSSIKLKIHLPGNVSFT